jgi:hypothetical protein
MAFQALPIEKSLGLFRHKGNAAGPEYQVHLGYLTDNLLTVPFRKAAGNHQRPEPATLFMPGGFKNGYDSLFFGISDKRACIYDDGIRLGQILDGDKAFFF